MTRPLEQCNWMPKVLKYPTFLIADVIIVYSNSICLVEFLVSCADLTLETCVIRYNVMYFVMFMRLRQ